MKGHKVITVERAGGYAARCELDRIEQAVITFGGFPTRTEAREAIVHTNQQEGEQITVNTTATDAHESRVREYLAAHPEIVKPVWASMIVAHLPQGGQPSIIWKRSVGDITVWRFDELSDGGDWETSDIEFTVDSLDGLTAAEARRIASEMLAAVAMVEASS